MSELLNRFVGGGSELILVNESVDAQNRKFPSILPWGEPPGTVRGEDILFLIHTDIFLLYKKEETQSIEV